MIARYALLTLGTIALAATPARAQLAADAVILEQVKIPELKKSVDLCPVALVPSDPKLGTWTYRGVTYRGSRPDALLEFLKDPQRYAKAAERERFIDNFMHAMSIIWCPVTDEVSPGGMTRWERLGYTWESCCAFCDETVDEKDFEKAVKRLRQRAEKCYDLIGAKYTEGAASPVEGAIRQPGEEADQ